MKQYQDHQAECQRRVTSYDEKLSHLEQVHDMQNKNYDLYTSQIFLVLLLQEVSSLNQKLIVVSRHAAEEAQHSGQSLKTQVC